MKTKKLDLEIDSIGGLTPLTEQERKEISDFIVTRKSEKAVGRKITKKKNGK